MNILRRYFFKEFFKYFFIIIFTFTAISIVVEFFDKASEFYSHKPSVTSVIQYLLLQSPRVILYALPFASMFSILITIGIASRWRETIIIKAAGSSTKKLFSSFLILGAVITVLAFFMGETIVPAATSKATLIRKIEILKESPKIIHSTKDVWLKGTDGSLIRIDGFIENENRILKTSIFNFNPQFGLEKRIEAEQGTWINDKWELNKVTVFDFKNKTSETVDTLISTALEEPKIFREEMKKPKEMNFIELQAYYSRLEKAGFKNIKYIIRLYEKLAYPTINFIMILIAIPLSLHSKLGGGIRAAGLGVIICVIYWLLYSVIISISNTGLLPPWLAPWIVPVLFCIVGSVMFVKIKE
ncbi:MAG: LptF/LptG family permease [Nitrospirota bacterium]